MLPSEVLISPLYSEVARQIAGQSKTFSVYIHLASGSVDVASGTSFSQKINALSPPNELLDHSEQQFNRISFIADIHFEFVDNASVADLAFYIDSEINLADDLNTLGLTLQNTDQISGRQWIEIYLNGPAISAESSPNLMLYVFNHELLHALGFEHTFDSTDGDFYLSTDPMLGATPHETVMSYRPPDGGSYPSDLSFSDYVALQEIWGTPSLASDGYKPVYRFLDSISGKHLFSSNSEEIDLITSNSNNSIFENEGIAFIPNPLANVDVHRFFNPTTNAHFYSANEFEKDFLINNSSSLVYEGVVFSAFSADSALPTSIPVSRFYDPINSLHFYTSTPEEELFWRQHNPDWIDEGVAWYV